MVLGSLSSRMRHLSQDPNGEEETLRERERVECGQ